jgi:sorting nexin-25
VRNVLEAQSPRHKNRVAHPVIAPTAETITIRTDARQFESFLRSINRFTSLLDARRLKNDVVGEIRRTRMLLGKYLPTTSIVISLNNTVANHENEDWINGEKTEDVVAFLDRLYTAKRKVEQRIVVLGGEDDSPGLEPVQAQKSLTDQGVGSRPRLTLRDVLRNPSSLSYFMEFMDRRRRSLLVQFWLTVESFKNPLESVESGSSGDEDEPIQDQSSLSNVKEDISMINDLYFSGSTLPPALSSISNKYVDIIRSFARGELPPSTATGRRVRRSVMLAQRQVEHDMEHDFEDFERSELWFRVVEDTGHNGTSAWSQPTAPMSKATRGMSHSDLESPPTSTYKEVRVSPQFLPRSESTPLLGPLTHSPRSGSSRSASSSPGHSPTGVSQPAGLRATPSNIDVLMAPVGDNSSEHSRAPLFDDPDDKQPQNADEAQRMEAIQAALTDIMAHEKQQKRKPATAENVDHVDDPNTGYDVRLTTETRRRRGVFDDLDEDNDNEVEDEDEERREGTGNGESGSFQLAAPGDLQLSYEIARLGNKISDLQSQDAMLDTLIKKADLTGDHQELRLLEKSKSSMNRELRELQFQRAQYQQQESANRLLPDRTKVTIVSSTVGEEDGKSVVRYLTQVQQLAQDGAFASGWVVARRYNEFLSMHNKLRERYVLVRNLDFPGKRLVTALSGSFVDTRRTALEKYMQVRWPHPSSLFCCVTDAIQNLIAIPVVCESDELRAFLSRESPFIAAELPATHSKGSAPFSGTDLVRTVYKSVTESIDDMFFGPSMLDVMIQRLTRQAAEFAGIVGSAVNDEDLVAQAIRAFGKMTSEDTLMQLSGDLKPLEGETSTSTFSAPICDLVLAVFELNKKDNWLRRQAIVIILQQVLGGTIERCAFCSPVRNLTSIHTY